MATTFTPAEIATRFQTDAKTLRRFLRASAKDGWMSERDYKAPGKGARWAIKGAHLNSLRGQFNTWLKDQEAARAARQEAASEAPADPAESQLAEEELTEAEIQELDSEDSDES
jgi:hypothetical protein